MRTEEEIRALRQGYRNEAKVAAKEDRPNTAYRLSIKADMLDWVLEEEEK